MEKVCVTTRKQWRKWLQSNHKKSPGIWLVFFKKHTGKATLEYDESVEEALCFGWIDSIIKKIDEEKFARKFTPRKPYSKWSPLNKKRVTKLTKASLMTKSGLDRVKDAKKLGTWGEKYGPDISFVIPEKFEKALSKSKKAKEFFESLTPTYKKHYIGWIAVAKKEETKNKRIKDAVSLLKQGKKLGLK
jgi:uncharacterized protein YdeI (YjbR/CyaY-like superfamily)